MDASSLESELMTPPKKFVKAYKLFRVDPKHPGKLFPLFVDANTPVEKGKWYPAKAGEMAGDKVKSKLGPLAYRPGWHAGDLPIATHIGSKSSNDLKRPDVRPPNQVWAEVHMPDDVDWQSEANRRGTNVQGKLIPVQAHITDQIPEGGHYRYKTNPNMTGNWLIGGAMKVHRVLSDDEVRRINQEAKSSDLPRTKPLKLADYGFNGGGKVTMRLALQQKALKAYHGTPHKFAPTERNPLGDIVHREKKGGIVHKAHGGAMPTLAQMKLALRGNQIRSVGANEAPNIQPKPHIRVDYMGGPGGVDMSPIPGQQLLPQSLQQQGQQGQQGMPQGPEGASEMGASQPGMPQMPQMSGANTNPISSGSNILSLTPQGQALSALKPQGMAEGGNKTTHDDIIRAMRGYDKGGKVHKYMDTICLEMSKKSPKRAK